jgi:hypothetical protein
VVAGGGGFAGASTGDDRKAEGLGMVIVSIIAASSKSSRHHGPEVSSVVDTGVG